MLNPYKKCSFIFVVFIYILGVVSGVQSALYLYDYYDDGIADYKSALIALIFIGFSLLWILFYFHRNREN